jgi:C1A family cysteine protease
MPMPQEHSNAHYGWKADHPDQRDFLLAASGPPINLPARTNNRATDVARFDQGNLGSCTDNATVGLYRATGKKLGKPDFIGSRLFLYYNTRLREGTVRSDSGATLRNTLKSIGHEGVCAEATWPYDIAKFTKRPLVAAYREAEKHQALQYLRVPQTIRGVKECLLDGFHFVFGFTVYESFESKEVARTGIMNMPSMSEKTLGGHAVRAVDYDDDLHGGCLVVANSWGEDWGDQGYFYMPYEYILRTDLAGDLWTIRETE